MKYNTQSLGPTKFPSKLGLSSVHGDIIANYVNDDSKIVIYPTYSNWEKYNIDGQEPDCFELAGPRKKLFFDVSDTKAAIVTCGGLCPGTNDVIRALVMSLYYRYHIKNIFGIRYGFRGMSLQHAGTARILDPDIIANIHSRGGSFLGSSRGMQNIIEMVDFLQRREIDILFTVGGDGTIRGSIELARECKSRSMSTAIIGIPKTIDNDIAFIDKSFGFSSAVAKAKEVIDAAHVEAKGVYNGIGLVKLMGRYSGFIASRASLASGEANFVLVPEVPFELTGDSGFLVSLQRRLANRQHALVVVAEGAGQQLMLQEKDCLKTDESGNPELADIGRFLEKKIEKYFNSKKIKAPVKYFDPSYLIRSTTANADDGIYCFELAENAVHAAMAGKTSVIIGIWGNQYVHIPMQVAISKRKVLDPDGPGWLAVVENTGQPLMIGRKM